MCFTEKRKQSLVDYKSFIDSLGNEENRLFVFRITHGSPVDKVLKSIRPFLKKGDIILNGVNERYLTLEAKQKELRRVWGGGFQPFMSSGSAHYFLVVHNGIK